MSKEILCSVNSKYLKEIEEIMSREKTAVLSMPNNGDFLDPKKLAEMDEEETKAFWEKSKCLII